MLQFSNLTIETAVANRSETMKVAVANQGGAMEFRDHFKNESSPKSQKSKGNTILMKSFGIIAIVVIMLSIVACSSPESDGIKAKKKYCNCLNKVRSKSLKEGEKYREEFHFYHSQGDTQNFNRIVRVLEEIDRQSEAKIFECLQNTKKEGEKYNTNQQNKSAFDYAFDNYTCK